MDVSAGSVRELRDWVRTQKEYCRPIEYNDFSPRELDEIRGPCAAYGAVVYGLIEDKLTELLGD